MNNVPSSERGVANAQERARGLPSGQGELILVVDDEELLCELATKTLESCGYRVITAPNGAEGVERLKENKEEIRLVITDAGMPVMDGLAMMSVMKECKPDLPVLLVSGSRHDTELLLRNSGKDVATLTKPYSLKQLLLAVEAALRR